MVRRPGEVAYVAPLSRPGLGRLTRAARRRQARPTPALPPPAVRGGGRRRRETSCPPAGRRDRRDGGASARVWLPRPRRRRNEKAASSGSRWGRLFPYPQACGLRHISVEEAPPAALQDRCERFEGDNLPQRPRLGTYRFLPSIPMVATTAPKRCPDRVTWSRPANCGPFPLGR